MVEKETDCRLKHLQVNVERLKSILLTSDLGRLTKLKWGAFSRLSFRLSSTSDIIATTTIRKTHPTLYFESFLISGAPSSQRHLKKLFQLISMRQQPTLKESLENDFLIKILIRTDVFEQKYSIINENSRVKFNKETNGKEACLW